MGGIFGIVSKEDCVSDLFYGTDYHSHLGTRYGGMAVRNGRGIERSIHNIENSYFRTKFEPELAGFHGGKGIGVISDTDPQPLIIGSHLGTFGIVTVGKINNLDELVQQGLRPAALFLGHHRRVASTPPRWWPRSSARRRTSRTASVTPRRPSRGPARCCCSPRKESMRRGTGWAARRSSSAGATAPWRSARSPAPFPTSASKPSAFSGPGEIVLMTADGVGTRVPPGSAACRSAPFSGCTTAIRPPDYEGINVEDVRNNCGAALARRDDTDSRLRGRHSGLGHWACHRLRHRAAIPYRRPFVKYTPTWPRSFMPQNQRMRDLVARMKLIPIRKLIDGKRLLFCEDSIVRGTQLKDNIQILFDYGARRSTCGRPVRR